jgi:hypothetical protein
MSSIPPAEPDFLLPSQTSAPNKRQRTGTPDDPGYVPGVEYDQWNRYLLPAPGGDPAELEPWTRVTTLTGMLTNSEGLRVWSERNIVEGIGLRADLRAAITADPRSKAVQDEVISVAKVVTRDEQAARWGRAVHRAIEGLSTPGTHSAIAPDPFEPFGRDVIAAMTCLAQNGITARTVEALVIHQTLGYAGRLDALWEVTLPDGRTVLRVGDVKTGKDLHKPEKRHPIGAQLGGYVNATHVYDPATRTFRPFGELGVDPTTGYVLSVREGTAQLYELDLATGWQRMLTAVKLHRDRKASVDMLPVGRPVTIEAPEPTPAAPPFRADPAIPEGTAVLVTAPGPGESFNPARHAVVIENVGAERAEADVPASASEPERSPSGRARRACSKCRRPGHTAKRCPGGEAPAADIRSSGAGGDVQPTASSVKICPHASGWTRRESDGAWVCVECGRPSEATVNALRTGGPLPTSATVAPEQTALPPTVENGAAVARLDPAPASVAQAEPTLFELILSARSQEELGQLWQAHAADWTDDHTAAAQARVATGLPVLDGTTSQ